MATFELFPKLPPELRAKIWDEALYEESSVRIVPVWTEGKAVGCVLPTKQLISPFLFVSRESRSRAVLVYDTSLPVWHRPLPRFRIRQIYDAQGHLRCSREMPGDRARREALEGVENIDASKCRGTIRLSLATDLFATGWWYVRYVGYVGFTAASCAQPIKGSWKRKPWLIPVKYLTSPLSEAQCLSVQRALKVHTIEGGELPDTPSLFAYEAFRRGWAKSEREVPGGTWGANLKQAKREDVTTFHGLEPIYGRMLPEPLFGNIKTSLHMMWDNSTSRALYEIAMLDGEVLLQKWKRCLREWIQDLMPF